MTDGRILKPSFAILGAISAVGMALGACNTPFIPVPPPGDPSFAALTITDPVMGNKTVWETRGDANARLVNAKVYIFNESTASGVIAVTGADGSYVAQPFDGSTGDRVEISYELLGDHERSGIICRILQPGPAHMPCP